MNNTKQDLTPLLYIGGGLLALKLVENILSDLGLSSVLTAAEKSKADALDVELSKQYDALSKVYKLSWTLDTYMTAVDSIYDSLKLSSASDQAEIADHAFTTTVNNPLDLVLLKSYYGIRPTFLLGFKEGAFSLIETLQREFADWRKKRTVEILDAKGVPLAL